MTTNPQWAMTTIETPQGITSYNSSQACFAKCGAPTAYLNTVVFEPNGGSNFQVTPETTTGWTVSQSGNRTILKRDSDTSPTFDETLKNITYQVEDSSSGTLGPAVNYFAYAGTMYPHPLPPVTGKVLDVNYPTYSKANSGTPAVYFVLTTTGVYRSEVDNTLTPIYEYGSELQNVYGSLAGLSLSLLIVGIHNPTSRFLTLSKLDVGTGVLTTITSFNQVTQLFGIIETGPETFKYAYYNIQSNRPMIYVQNVATGATRNIDNSLFSNVGGTCRFFKASYIVLAQSNLLYGALFSANLMNPTDYTGLTNAQFSSSGSPPIVESLMVPAVQSIGVFVQDNNGQLYAANLTSGTMSWSRKITSSQLTTAFGTNNIRIIRLYGFYPVNYFLCINEDTGVCSIRDSNLDEPADLSSYDNFQYMSPGFVTTRDISANWGYFLQLNDGTTYIYDAQYRTGLRASVTTSVEPPSAIPDIKEAEQSSTSYAYSTTTFKPFDDVNMNSTVSEVKVECANTTFEVDTLDGWTQQVTGDVLVLTRLVFNVGDTPNEVLRKVSMLATHDVGPTTTTVTAKTYVNNMPFTLAQDERVTAVTASNDGTAVIVAICVGDGTTASGTKARLQAFTISTEGVISESWNHTYPDNTGIITAVVSCTSDDIYILSGADDIGYVPGAYKNSTVTELFLSTSQFPTEYRNATFQTLTGNGLKGALVHVEMSNLSVSALAYRINDTVTGLLSTDIVTHAPNSALGVSRVACQDEAAGFTNVWFEGLGSLWSIPYGAIAEATDIAQPFSNIQTNSNVVFPTTPLGTTVVCAGRSSRGLFNYGIGNDNNLYAVEVSGSISYSAYPLQWKLIANFLGSELIRQLVCSSDTDEEFYCILEDSSTSTFSLALLTVNAIPGNVSTLSANILGTVSAMATLSVTSGRSIVFRDNGVGGVIGNSTSVTRALINEIPAPEPTPTPTPTETPVTPTPTTTVSPSPDTGNSSGLTLVEYVGYGSAGFVLLILIKKPIYFATSFCAPPRLTRLRQPHPVRPASPRGSFRGKSVGMASGPPGVPPQ